MFFFWQYCTILFHSKSRTICNVVDRSLSMYVAIEGQAEPNNFVDQEVKKDQTA